MQPQPVVSVVLGCVLGVGGSDAQRSADTASGKTSCFMGLMVGKRMAAKHNLRGPDRSPWRNLKTGATARLALQTGRHGPKARRADPGWAGSHPAAA